MSFPNNRSAYRRTAWLLASLLLCACQDSAPPPSPAAKAEATPPAPAEARAVRCVKLE